MKWQAIAKRECPYCKAQLTSVTNPVDEVDDPTPRSGDISICAACFKPLRVDETLNFVPFDTAVLNEEERQYLDEVAKTFKRLRAKALSH